MSHRVSVVIPVRNDAADLPSAIESVLAQPGVAEVIICAGPSEDDSREVAREAARVNESVRVLDNPHGGIPQALNLGLASACCDVLVRVDARSVIPPTYIRDAIETRDEVSASNVGAVQRAVGTSTFERAVAAAMGTRAGSGGAAYRSAGERRPVDTAFLGVFDVDALRSVGGWDESFARNEDAELNHRLNEAGYQVWLDPRLVVEYRPRPTLAKLASQYWQYGWWRLRTVRKHPSSLKVRQLASPLIFVALLAALTLSLVTPWTWVVPTTYFAAVLLAGVFSEGPLHQRLLTSAALITMHLSWGAGFLVSAVVSGGRRRTPEA